MDTEPWYNEPPNMSMMNTFPQSPLHFLYQGFNKVIGSNPFNQKFWFELPKFQCVKRNSIFHFTEPVMSKWQVCGLTLV